MLRERGESRGSGQPACPISLQPISDDDLPFLHRLYASTREEELAVTGWSEEQKASFLQQQFDAQHRYYQEHYRDTRFDLILEGDEPVGRLYVSRRPDEIRIVDIALLPEHRGQGIGGELIRAVLTEAGADQKPVRIHVEHYNRALGLYESLGFRRTGDTGVYFLMEWQPPTV